ncbi:amidohydrolase [Elongatibacter sediminis]|uniref:Amidohydrolase n=1 Tax=Elongatibacter sediminis TaxID=3119006 RepID=A0AAW9RDJ9_9GAMM
MLLLAFSVGVRAELADVMFVNGAIYTVNDTQLWAEALAVKDQRIVFVGAEREAQAYLDESTRIIDLDGRMVMPGIHDAHQHLMQGGHISLGCLLPIGIEGERFIDVLKDVLRDCESRLEEGEWLVGRGFFSEQFPDGAPHRKYLDELFPDRPVWLTERTGHNGLANSRALEIAGVTVDTVAPAGGTITRDEDGLPTGELVEKATALVRNIIPPPTPERNLKAVREAIRVCHQYGITSIQEAGTTKDLLVALQKLEMASELTLDVTSHLVWGRGDDLAGQLALIENRGMYESTHVNPNNVKVWMDGTPTGPYFTQADLDPETGEPEWEYILVSPDLMNEYVPKFDALGMKVKVHVAGKGAAHVALDAFELAKQKNPGSRVRHELGHTALVSGQDMDRMRELNVIGDMSPTQWQLHEPFGDPPEDPWEFRTLSNKGVMLTIGTDWPVTRTPELFEALEGLLMFGDESLDLQSAIRLMTLNGAIAVDRHEDLGSLVPGKLANLIVLDRNLFAIEPEEISETTVLMTMFEGKVVFDRH